MQNTSTIELGTSRFSRLSDDELFAEIEADEQKKRRTGELPYRVGERAVSSFQSFFRDLKDGFSLPKGANIKYAR